MPARTTPFQTFITHIYEQLAGDSNTKITESFMIKESDGNPHREIDILIQKNVSGKEFKIAVECREWEDKNDIKWIDELIGKYIDLPIDEVIAVSKSGFTGPAITKAQLHNIKTLTLEQASQIDWEKRFTDLFVKLIQRNDILKSVVVTTDLSINPTMISPKTIVYYQANPIGTFEDVRRQCYEHNIYQINEEIKKLIDEKKQEVFSKKLNILFPAIPSQEIHFFVNNERIKILQILMDLECTFTVSDVKANQHFFDNIGITETKIENDGQTYQVIAVQEEGKLPVIKKHLIKDVSKKGQSKKKPKTT